MSKALIIVESPAKIKTLKKFLGSSYIFESSIGHIRDLPVREFGIDIENNFEPTYATLENKKEVIDKLQKAAKKCDIVYLSPDPDREGEAIAWHISQILPSSTKTKRVSFNAITKDAVAKALENPREIDMDLVDAQQARRLLDRIVGYKISPLLNRRIQRGKEQSLSAGRVQSVALMLVVKRELEIEAFKPTEYWNLSAHFKTTLDPKIFKSHLYSVSGKKFEKEPVDGKDYLIINNAETANQILAKIKQGPFVVKKVDKKEKNRHPVPPFITSTLQQEASRHHSFSASRTMSTAQSLYEGIDLGKDGQEGLITYMRTDSVRIEPEATAELKKYIKKTYGEKYLSATTRNYSTKKSAQDAHEAIRPTNLNYSPDEIKAYLTFDQFKLYSLIWKRYVASQMSSAIYDTVSADILVGDEIIMRATGSTIKFSGFLAAYEEKNDDDKLEDEAVLPELKDGQELILTDAAGDQAFTKPPPRFSEASLVKELEKSGIGRPSTYAAIMNKIQSREYTVKEGGRLKPTELGRVISQMLENSFPQIMDVSFTAQLEDSLEAVAEHKKEWRLLISEFWQQFNPMLEVALKEAYVPKVATDIKCPKCPDGHLQKIWAKSKYFYGCDKYPDCDFSATLEELNFNKDDYDEKFDWQQKCPICQEEMKVRHGKFGAFLGCTRYPDCRGIIAIPKKGEEVVPVEDLPDCPAVGCPGKLMPKKSRFGKIFYSCSTFPECDVVGNSIEQTLEKYQDYPRTKYQKKGAKKESKSSKAKTKALAAQKKSDTKKAAPKKPRQMPSYALSDELATIVKAKELTRGEVIKKVWDYIKENSLQDNQNKRIIVPDEKLGKVFGSKEPIDMMQISKLIGGHILK